MRPNETVTIIIADKHEIFRQGFKQILANQHPAIFNCIAEVSNGIELIEKVKTLRPDIVITEINMPVLDGIQACRIIKDLYPKTEVIALSIFNQESLILEMIDAGARGNLDKSANKEEVIKVLQKVSEGFDYYGDAISEQILDNLRNNNLKKHKPKKIHLSIQELKVIRLLCKEQTTKEIAHSLQLGIRSVEDYRHHIQEKIGAKNVVGIIIYAFMNELVKLREL